MTQNTHTPDALLAFIEAAPPGVTRALAALSAAVSLTDDVAYSLLNEHVPPEYSARNILDALHASEFIVERNSEWHLQPEARRYLLDQLEKERELAASAHRLLLQLTENELIGEQTSLPVYLTWPIARAYHIAPFDAEAALRLYADSYTGHYTGDQWLLTELASEQQERRILPPEAIEPAFFQGMLAYREGRFDAASAFLQRVAKSSEVRLEVAIALHVLALLERRSRRYSQSETLLRRSLRIGEALGASYHQAHVLHTLGTAVAKYNEKEGESLLNRSLEIGEKNGYAYHTAQVLNSLGNLIAEADLQLAERLLNRSIAIFEELHDSDSAAWVLCSLGNARRRRKQWKPARQAYERALSLSDSPRNLAVGHLGLSHVAEHLDHDIPAAIGQMQLAIDAQIATGDTRRVEQHRVRLAKLKEKGKR